MGFRLKADQAVSLEVRRIILKQLDLATSELTSIGDPESDEAIHQARRRVKKIRAVLRLVRPVLDSASGAVDRDFRRVNQLLAPVADGQGVIGTLNTLARRYRRALPRKTVATLRADLVHRGRRIDSQADADRVLEKASSLLLARRRNVRRWRLTAEEFAAIAPGLKQCVRRARHAMVAAWLHPTAARLHAWRHHVKAHWFHVRLLEDRCDNRLMPIERRLEALDGVLGEYHNLALLHGVLVSETALSSVEVVRCRRVVARYQRALRRHAQLLGIRIYSDKPRRFVRHVKRLWRSGETPRRQVSS